MLLMLETVTEPLRSGLEFGVSGQGTSEMLPIV